MPRKKPNGNAIYSVKLEVGGTTKIFTLRVGKNFTELSLVEGGKLTEICACRTCDGQGHVVWDPDDKSIPY